MNYNAGSFPPNGPSSDLFHKFVIGVVLAVFLFVLLGILASLSGSDIALNFQSEMVKHRDKVCQEGCRHSAFPEQCYWGCMNEGTIR